MFYVEGIESNNVAAEEDIVVEIDPDGSGTFICMDAVRYSVVRDPVPPQPPAAGTPIPVDVVGVSEGCDCPGPIAPDLRNEGRQRIMARFGQEVRDQTDLLIKGRDDATTLTLQRRHMTRCNYPNSIFGPAWSFNYTQTLKREGSDVRMESFGRVDTFEAVMGMSDAWVGREGRFDRLTYDGGAKEYKLRMRNGTRMIFAADPGIIRSGCSRAPLQHYFSE